MGCVFCGGKVQLQNVTFVYDYDEEYFLIKNVPAEVCTQCGEKTYSPEVTDALIHFAEKRLAPVGTMQVPVFDYGGQVVS